MLNVISNGKLSPLARNVASVGKYTARNLMVTKTIEGYSSLLENILNFPSEVASPRAISEIPQNLKTEWQWHRFENIEGQTYQDRTLRSLLFLDELEKQQNKSQGERFGTVVADDSFVYSIWEEEKFIQMVNTRKRREDEEVSCQLNIRYYILKVGC